MGWLNIAAELVRGAMIARQERPPRPEVNLIEDSAGLADLVQQYRSEVDRGFEALTQALQEQNEQNRQALRVQRRWNYGLLVGLLVVAALVVALYMR